MISRDFCCCCCCFFSLSLCYVYYYFFLFFSSPFFLSFVIFILDVLPAVVLYRSLQSVEKAVWTVDTHTKQETLSCCAFLRPKKDGTWCTSEFFHPCFSSSFLLFFLSHFLFICFFLFLTKSWCKPRWLPWFLLDYFPPFLLFLWRPSLHTHKTLAHPKNTMTSLLVSIVYSLSSSSTRWSGIKISLSYLFPIWRKKTLSKSGPTNETIIGLLLLLADQRLRKQMNIVRKMVRHLLFETFPTGGGFFLSLFVFLEFFLKYDFFFHNHLDDVCRFRKSPTYIFSPLGRDKTPSQLLRTQIVLGGLTDTEKTSTGWSDLESFVLHPLSSCDTFC